MRFFKQFLYGIFYVAIIVLIGWGVKVRYFTIVPSCTNNIQDQGEQGIDCGGVCGNVCVVSLAAVQTLSTSVFPNGPSHGTLLAKIANPNSSAGTKILSYAFEVAGGNTQSVPGTTFLYPGQIRYVVIPNYPIAVLTSTSVSFNSSNVSWIPAATMGSAPVFGLQDVRTFEDSPDSVAAQGVLINQEPIMIAHVIVDAIFKNASGAAVGASETILDNVPANGSVPFLISYPTGDPSLDLSQTEVVAYALQ